MALSAELLLAPGHAQSGQTEALRSFGVLSGLAGILGRSGGLISRLGLGGASLGGRTIPAGTKVTALATRSPSPVTTIARRGGVIAGAGAAFELGSRALPGGASFPGGSAVPSFFNRSASGGGAGDFQVGAQFGDTFITRVWQSGETAGGVPIIHGMLANGKRFVTNRFGTIRVFRVKKPIVIGGNPRLSDAGRLASAAKRMEKTAVKILDINGKKAVRR